MAFEAPITIAKALDRIHRREYVLRAIQRESYGAVTKSRVCLTASCADMRAEFFEYFGRDNVRRFWKRPSKALDSAIDHAREQGLIVEIPATGTAAAK
jgi:type IV secretory pathway component VirB8